MTTLAVGAVVLRGRTVLLVRRGRAPSAGAWSLPGGRPEPGETWARALVREVHEETGLSIRPIRLLAAARLADFAILDYLAGAPEGDPVAGDDAAEARFVPTEALAGLGVSEAVARMIGLASSSPEPE